MTKSLNVTNKKEYEAVCNCNWDICWYNSSFLSLVCDDFIESGFPSENTFWVLNVFYAPGSVFESNAKWNENNRFDVVNIYGNGAKIKASSKDRDENKWIVTKSNQVYMIDNLTVEGFNNAIENREGCIILNNVHLNHNRMDYIIDHDDGAAILNIAGTVICNNCTFSNNYAKYGGAIYNQGLLNLTNCSFKANTGYGSGDDVLNVADGIVIVDGAEIKGTEGVVNYLYSVHKILKSVAIVTVTIVAAGACVCVGLLLSTVLTGAAFVVATTAACIFTVGVFILGGVLIYKAIPDVRK